MAGNIHRYLADDHRRLDALLERAMSDPENIDAPAYAQFRAGLLRHIGMEEKLLLPAARQHRGGEPLPEAPRLRLDHGALTALLVPSPTAPIVAAVRAILAIHNRIEEDPGGVYDQCAQLTNGEMEDVLRRLQSFPAVKVLPHVDSRLVREAARRALARAGYDLEV